MWNATYPHSSKYPSQQSLRKYICEIMLVDITEVECIESGAYKHLYYFIPIKLLWNVIYNSQVLLIKGESFKLIIFHIL